MDYWNSVLLISGISLVGLAILLLFVGCKIWKNLVVTLVITSLLGLLIICTIHFIFSDSIDFFGENPAADKDNLLLEIGLLSLLMGGVSTFIMMLGTLIAKNNREKLE